MDVGHHSDDENMDEDHDVEMDYGEETGSDDTSSSDLDHEDEGHHTPDPGSGEGWDDDLVGLQGEEDEEDEEGDEDEDEDEEVEDNDDDEGMDDDEEDEAIMWEVRWNSYLVSEMMLTDSLQDTREGEGTLGVGMTLEDVDNEVGHGGKF